MSRLYGDIHRAIQMAFDTRALADRIEAIAVKPEIDDAAKAFIESGADLEEFKEAEMAVKVTIQETWMDCPRYIHRFERRERSRYAPDVEQATPFCEWKRIDALQDVVRPTERAKVEQLGTITIDDGMSKVSTGDKVA